MLARLGNSLVYIRLTLKKSASLPMFRFVSSISDRRILPLGILLLTAAGGTVAAPLPALDLAMTTTAQLVFPSEPGKVYRVLASTDLKTWPVAGEPVFGTGEEIALWTPSPPEGTGTQFFRILSETEPAGGLAPWKMPAAPILFNDGDRTGKYEFAADGAGSWKSGENTKAFTWVWLRTGMDTGKITLTWAAGGQEILKLTYTAAQLGRFERGEWMDGMEISTDSGTFGPVPADGAPALPATLSGRRVTLADGSVGSALTFDSANAGSRTLDGQSRAVTYSWLVTGGSTVTLTTNLSTTHGEEYRLVFNGPQSGKFVRRTFTEGVFRDEDSGSFSLSDPAR